MNSSANTQIGLHCFFKTKSLNKRKRKISIQDFMRAMRKTLVGWIIKGIIGIVTKRYKDPYEATMESTWVSHLVVPPWLKFLSGQT